MDRDKIIQFVDKACNFLIKDQNKDGSWTLNGEKIKSPPVPYQKSLILTSQAVQALIYNVKPEYVDAIQKGLHFCISYPLSKDDPIDLWAWKLSALYFSNILRSEKSKQEILEVIKEKQEDSGAWPYYPNTFTLTNYSVSNSIYKYDLTSKNRAIHWFNSAKKKEGWSKDGSDKNIEPSFTANAMLSLIKLGETPPIESIRYLEKEQKENGGWRVLKDSGNWGSITSYSTSLCILALILSRGNPDKIEKGIEYLLQCQEDSGKITRTPVEKEKYHYLFYYVIKALMYYISNVSSLREFEFVKKRELFVSSYKNVLMSRALGVTEKSRKRRIDILKALENGSKEIAQIIDYLKLDKKYSHLNKKSHITQIKSDVEYLRSIRLIGKLDRKYFISLDLL